MKLWLTYAWKDNEEDDVDHIVTELEAGGLNVEFDRVRLVAGRRLWDQIDQAIRDPEVSGWAIYVTEHSLRSEPCQEELAYALDRTLRTRGADFPLIGLFPGNLDGEIIPSALATRLYVNLRTNDWVQQVANGLTGTQTARPKDTLPFGHKLHRRENGFCLEFWPRTGTWTPTVAIVREHEAKKLTSLSAGPRGQLDGIRMIMCGSNTENGFFGRIIQNPIDAVTSAQVSLSALPSWLEFGPQNGERFHMELSAGT